MDPANVVSPREKLRNLRIIHTNPDEAWSVAEFEWFHEDDGEWRPRVGVRWDGARGELGNPQSSGHPTWFLLPERIDAQAFIELALDR